MRQHWDRYFMDMAWLVSSRATCERLKVGCVLVKDRHVISTGYNGSLPGHPHCAEQGCQMLDSHCIRTIHAEANAVAQAAQHGHTTDGCLVYLTHSSCWNCTKLLISAGARGILYDASYGNVELSRDFCRDSKVWFGSATDCNTSLMGPGANLKLLADLSFGKA